MPVLSAANVVQEKVGTQAFASSATITLDTPTTAGGTVVVEMFGPIFWPGMPLGWEFDATAVPSGPLLWVFRQSGGPGGETSWTWTLAAGSNNWAWRATEFDVALDPVSPCETVAATSAGGTGVTTVSTGTSGTTNRAEVVCLATHLWNYPAADAARTVSFGSHTNGFTVRDALRQSWSAMELDVSWSWLFASATGTFECTATVSNSAPNASDAYYSTLAVYAATQPVDPGPGVLAAPGVAP
jgi:hypothetical protein